MWQGGAIMLKVDVVISIVCASAIKLSQVDSRQSELLLGPICFFAGRGSSKVFQP